MLKAIGGVILGYVVLFVAVFVLLTAAYLAIGADGAFKPASYDVTPLWLVIWFVVSLGAAVAGGKVCAIIAKNAKAVLALAGIVLILGLCSATLVLMASDTGEAKVRTGDVPNMEAMMNAKQPTWVALLTPLIGVAGVMIGGRLKGSEKKD
jgi:hypothetical protein